MKKIQAKAKAEQEDLGRAELKLITSTLKELLFTAKVSGQYRDVKKVTMFGSARAFIRGKHHPAC
jgi:hypothetical protein